MRVRKVRGVRGFGCFRRSEAIDATEGMSKSAEKGQTGGVLGQSDVRRESAAAGLMGLRNGETSGREPLCRSRIGPAGRLTGVVTRGLGSGRVSEAREAVEGVSTWLYGSVLDGVSEGRGNLTGDLTGHLPTRLTPCLPRDLTFSGFRGVEQPSKRAQDTAWRP